jgi:hypothetical protein
MMRMSNRRRQRNISRRLVKGRYVAADGSTAFAAALLNALRREDLAHTPQEKMKRVSRVRAPSANWGSSNSPRRVEYPGSKKGVNSYVP